MAFKNPYNKDGKYRPLIWEENNALSENQKVLISITQGVPFVKSFTIRATGNFTSENKCLTCGPPVTKLGLNAVPSLGFGHAEETVFFIDTNGAKIEDFTFKIRRFTTGITALKEANKQFAGSKRPRFEDGPSNANVQVVPVLDASTRLYKIFSMDAPNIPFLGADGINSFSSTIVEALQMGNFEEQVEITNTKTNGIIVDATVAKWHTKIYIIKSLVSVSGWALNTAQGSNEIGSGHQVLPQ